MRIDCTTRAALSVTLLTLAATSAQAQVSKGYKDLGVVLGVGNVSNALAFGVRFESVFKRLPDLGNGTLGIGLSADFYNYSERFGQFRAKGSVVPIGATANYHFNIDPRRHLDAFVGAGLGVNVNNCSYDGPKGRSGDGCDDGGLYVIGRLGGRYFFNPNLALYGDVGAGAATLHLGLTARLR
jgi:hypothetical protein